MMREFRFQNLILAAMMGLVIWAFVQVDAPFVLGLGAGIVTAAALVAWRRAEVRSTADTTPPGLFPFDLSRNRALALLALLLIVSFAVRFHGLTRLIAWADEMWTLRNFYTSDLGTLLHVAFEDYWPPLHYLILNAVTRVTDTSLFWMRLPSVVFGSLTVIAMYLVGRELFRNRLAALLGAALLAGMTVHVLYSQEARVYAMHTFLTVLSAWLFYRSFWQRRISPAFLIVTTLLTYSHSFASWYFIAAQCVYVAVAGFLWKDRKAFAKGFQSQLLVLLLWMPLVAAFVWTRFSREIVVPTYWGTGQETPLGLVDVVLQYQALAVRSWAGAAFLLLAYLLSLVPLLRRRESRGSVDETGPDANFEFAKVFVFLFSWATVPLVFSFVVTAATTLDTFGSARYHLTALPALCLLAVAGMAVVKSRPALAAVGLIVLLLPSAQLARHFREFEIDRPAMDEAAEIVLTNGDDSEPIYVQNGFRAFAYYHRGEFPAIGSPRFEDRAARYGHLTDVRTVDTGKRGDTYAYEKFNPRIKFAGFYIWSRPDPFDEFVREELDRGGFTGQYWLVLEEPGDEEFRGALDRAGVVCEPADTF
ncbi:MAG: glycosyltransferase family 39 protein, partial [Longimicrobiales bacterium]